MSNITLTLFIAGGTANSTRAQQNLKDVMRNLEQPQPEIIIVDLLKDPSRALQEGILVTPTLMLQANNHRETIIGTLDDTEELLQQIRSWL